MKRFSTNENVVLKASNVIKALCFLKGPIKPILDANALIPLANAIHDRKADEKIRKAAMKQ